MEARWKSPRRAGLATPSPRLAWGVKHVVGTEEMLYLEALRFKNKQIARTTGHDPKTVREYISEYTRRGL